MFESKIGWRFPHGLISIINDSYSFNYFPWGFEHANKCKLPFQNQSPQVFRVLLFLKAHRQISERRCFKKYCPYDKACQF